MERRSIERLIFTILFFPCAVLGCGYTFTGIGDLPAGVDTVFISVFENRSLLTGIENDFTNSLIQEFTRRRAGSLAEKDEADAVFYGVIRSITTDTVSHRDEYASVERRTKVTLSVRLVSRDGRTIWAADNIRDDEVYMVEPEKYVTEQNLRKAVIKLSEDMAERVYNQMTANF